VELSRERHDFLQTNEVIFCGKWGDMWEYIGVHAVMSYAAGVQAGFVYSESTKVKHEFAIHLNST